MKWSLIVTCVMITMSASGTFAVLTTALRADLLAVQLICSAGAIWGLCLTTWWIRWLIKEELR